MIVIATARTVALKLRLVPFLRPSIGAAVGLALGAAAAVVVAPTLHAQDAAVPVSTGATLELIDDAAVRLALRTLITDAAANGLPTGPLVTKVREGVAKHAEPERIRSATSLLAQRLAVAATALAPTRSSEELAAGADALQAGVPSGTLRSMRRDWPSKPLTIPLGVLAEMVASGVPHASASRRVHELLAKGATPGQLASLGTSVRADIAAGLAPDDAMELRSKGVLSLLYQQAQLGIAAPGSAKLRPHEPPRK